MTIKRSSQYLFLALLLVVMPCLCASALAASCSIPLDSSTRTGKTGGKMARTITAGPAYIAPDTGEGPTRLATFALGWFWGTDSRFGSIDGVISTLAGYTGGATADPTYRSMSDHTESLLVEYDPAKVSYEELMEVFWSGHNPTEKHSFTQYMPALFYHTREQEKLALRLKDELSGKLGREIHTLVTGAANFYPAEDYHQKYGIRHHKIVWRSLLDNLGSEEALFASTAAARVNGALAGHIPPERLAGEIGSYGLSTEATEYLTLKVSRLHRKR